MRGRDHYLSRRHKKRCVALLCSLRRSAQKLADPRPRHTLGTSSSDSIYDGMLALSSRVSRPTKQHLRQRPLHGTRFIEGLELGRRAICMINDFLENGASDHLRNLALATMA